jgi:hypothetical protein
MAYLSPLCTNSGRIAALPRTDAMCHSRRLNFVHTVSLPNANASCARRELRPMKECQSEALPSVLAHRRNHDAVWQGQPEEPERLE